MRNGAHNQTINSREVYSIKYILRFTRTGLQFVRPSIWIQFYAGVHNK